MNKARRLLSFVVSLFLLALPVALWFQRQAIFDWWRLRNYQASAAIQALAASDTMKPAAQKYFYVTHPELAEKPTVASQCRGNDAEQSIVLGCYISGHQRIYVLNVTDPRLKGIHEVTAAHEMLHAAYERLSVKDREHIDSLTADFYAKLTDERIKDTVKQYREQDESSVPNELHSILGTEVRNLTPELEAYYQRYFSNRLAVVGFSEQYEKTFTELKDKIKKDEAELIKLKAQIDKNQAELQTRHASLEQQRSRLEQLRAAGRIDEYNASLPAYNNQVREYNNLLTLTQALISRYNSLVDEIKAIQVEQEELFQSIDSRSLPPKQ